MDFRPQDFYIGDCRAVADGPYSAPLYVSRRALAVYLRWQFGQRRAVELLASAPKGGTRVYYRTRTAAKLGEVGIQRIVNNQLGRLGYGPGDFGVIAP